jgi:hypothetical protein
MIGIYKITNKTNGKVYIGGSVDVVGRRSQHFSGNKNHNDLHLDIELLGKENFLFEVVEECGEEDLRERETFHIKQNFLEKQVLYNKTPLSGGRATFEQWVRSEEIKELLVEGILGLKEIAERFNVCVDTVRDINSGQTWKDDNKSYPINKEFVSNQIAGVRPRQVERPIPEVLEKMIQDYGFEETGRRFEVSGNAIKKWCLDYGMSKYSKDYKPLRPEKKVGRSQNELEEVAHQVKDLLQNSKLSMREIERRLFYNRKSITLINQGEIYFDPELVYPLRKTKKQNC